jgi:hypothetical protein
MNELILYLFADTKTPSPSGGGVLFLVFLSWIEIKLKPRAVKPGGVLGKVLIKAWGRRRKL